MNTTTTTRYICTGSVRGQCQHIHRTLTGAVDCLRRDRRACKRQGGYSDRAVERTNLVPLTRDEFDEVQRLLDNEK